MIGRLLLAVAMASLPVRASSSVIVPMEPSGGWVAQLGDTACTFSRSYSAGGATIMLAFQPLPGQNIIEVALVAPYRGPTKPTWGSGALRLLPNGRQVEMSYAIYPAPDGRAVIRFLADPDELGDLAAAAKLRVDLRAGSIFDFELAAFADARKSVETCEDDVTRKLGFDPAILGHLSAQPKPLSSPENWLTSADYPAEALRVGASGIVGFRLTVDIAGKASNCTIVESTGNAALDSHACDAMLKHARFRPAMGPDRKPVPGLWYNRVRFIIPLD